MFKVNQYRNRASEYAERAKSAQGPAEAREYSGLEKSFTTLADNEEWLSKNHKQTVHTPAPDLPDAPNLAQQEEHLLRCLGAAVIMQWDALPPHTQRQLFDSATTMSDPLDVASLQGRIARFLHKHQATTQPAALDDPERFPAEEVAR
jgi:hypothetical protein